MSDPNDLSTIYTMISTSRLTVNENCTKCQCQFVRLYNQRQALRAARTKRSAREAKELEKLKALYSSLGLVYTA